MTSWDVHAAARLEELRGQFESAGLSEFVRAAASEVWRINRDRHEPEEAYDDAFTLSLISARNLANRLLAEIPQCRQLRTAGVSAVKEAGSTVLRTAHADVRLVKAPHGSGRHPDFVSGFDWSPSEGRCAAALRNHAAYAPPPSDPGSDPLFELALPGAEAAAARCRDVFLVWGAELSTGLTAGWIGFPTIGAPPWVSVTPLWWDVMPARAVTSHHDADPADRLATFGDKRAPVPAISLKARTQEAGQKR